MLTVVHRRAIHRIIVFVFTLVTGIVVIAGYVVQAFIPYPHIDVSGAVADIVIVAWYAVTVVLLWLALGPLIIAAAVAPNVGIGSWFFACPDICPISLVGWLVAVVSFAVYVEAVHGVVSVVKHIRQ